MIKIVQASITQRCQSIRIVQASITQHCLNVRRVQASVILYCLNGNFGGLLLDEWYLGCDLVKG